MPTVEAPAVSVVVPTHNRAPKLARVLEALAEVECPIGGFEVIVVDDGSVDDTAAVVAAASLPVVLIRQANAGAASARNRGWRAGRAPVIAFLDDDCVPSRTWLIDLVNASEADAAIGAVGGAIVPLEPGTRATFVQLDRLVAHGADGEREVRYLVTANMIVRREVLESLDGFDERFPVGEDTDFGARVRASGRKLAVIDGGVVAHDHRLGLREILATYRKAGRARHLLAGRHRELSAQAGTRLIARPAHWIACYRRYRTAAGPITALGFVTLRAAGMASFAYGYLVDGRRDQRPGQLRPVGVR
ncbi:MAG: glycosyltransferase [Acidimicrobiales bacterium]